MLDRDNAVMHGVALKTIRRWRREYQRRGKPRGQAHCRAPCPICGAGRLDGSAYAHLLGWYLGDGHIVLCKRGVYSLSIYDDARYDRLNQEIRESLVAVKPGGRPYTRRLPGCLVTTLYWKHWPCLFPQHGPGRKHQRTISLEPWQRLIVEQATGPFLRGLFHSDGWRVVNRTSRLVRGEVRRYEYPRYFFSNRSTDIIGLCTWALDLLGVEWRMDGPRNVSVAKKASVAELDTHVGPKA